MDPARLKAKRGQVKASITVLEKWVSQKAQEAGREEIEVRLRKLKKYEEQFEEIQSKLDDEVDVDELPAEHQERIEVDERLSVLEASLLEYKHTFDTSTNLNETTANNISLDLVTSDLPQIELPKFNGEYLQYPQFIDSFNALVHNVKGRGMTDIRRFGLLKSSLVGKARDSIANLPLVAGNYQVALDILKERFYKPRLIFTSYIRKLWEAPKASGTESLRQLCDTHSSIRKGLELIATPEQISCGIMIQLMLTKCDQKTVEEWERVSAPKDELPGDSEFSDFLRKRCTQLEGIDYAARTTNKQPQQQTAPFKPRNRVANTSSKGNNTKLMCPQCKGNHIIEKCSEFMNETPKGRYIKARHHQICVRCLRNPRGHANCTNTCETCGSNHHSLLHFNPDSPPSGSKGENAGTTPTTTNVSQVMTDTVTGNTSIHKGGLESSHDPSCDTYTFLATAIVKVQTVDGNYVPLRVLFDGGSQLNLISDRARQLLGVATSDTKHQIRLSGINNSTMTLRKRVFVKLKSAYSSFEDSVMLVVHPRLRQVHPGHNINISDWKMPDNVQLADRDFNRSQPIDIILNAHHVDTYTLSKNFSLGKNLPRLRETKFGWVVVGDWVSRPSALSFTNIATDDGLTSPDEDLSSLLRQFWEIEATKPTKYLSGDEKDMEQHFSQTTTRTQDGRFVVRLPFARSPELLGESRAIAERRLSTIVRKIYSHEDYGKQYVDFIREYNALGHCSEVAKPEVRAPHYYIPHFSVTNENSTTTRTRVVFDASCRTENDISLNELLMVGPKLQDDLFIHLLRFRLHKFVLTGDVSKMYRQILVHQDDRKFQYILWKDPHTDKNCRTYELNTVTYGTASAPFHAVRCMQELARIDGDDLPLGRHVLLNNFYVDDMLTGADDEQTITDIYTEVKKLLSGKMDIRKFQSNSRKALMDIPPEDHGTFLHIGSSEVLKTLGMIWDPTRDEFSYYYEPNDSPKLTRRVILSEISRLFDPLGLIQPVVIKAKLFMQRLYAATSNWDDPVTPDDALLWAGLKFEMSHVSDLKVPRAVIDSFANKENATFEIHGFCDASEVAYAAAIYITSIHHGFFDSVLLTSKTRVAPLKKISLPKLELCGALLLSELYEVVKPVLNLVGKVYFWTDSTITLRWVTQSPHKWKPFVATRATKIQEATMDGKWGHVRSEQNPADLATRGMSPMELRKSFLWWNGPKFLKRSNEPWPVDPTLNDDDDVPERAKVVTSLITTTDIDLISRCKIMSFVPLISAAAWPKLKKTFGYVHRFITNARKKSTPKRSQLSKFDDTPLLTVDEMNHGEKLIVKIIQRMSFSHELAGLVANRSFPAHSKFGKLSVFLDDEGVMRVGGRNRNSPEVSELAEKFPCVMPPDHVITRLIFTWYHHENLHAGPTALLTFVRQRFWPLHGKVLANQTVHACIRCTRAKPVTYKQIMGDLPADRVTFTRPFEVTAVDFAGPFMVHYRLRGSKLTKAYLAVFVCFSSKAVHLELVEDLTSKAFLDCLQRFTSRRSTPKKIWSDNATNFVGASRKLHEFKAFYFNDETQKKISQWCRDHKGLQWCFTPPRSPHFNGLVEAAVKSAKYHLVRLAQLESLTFPELNTVIIMVEGILNSRPLTPLSCDPADGQPLTPAHLLLGTSLQPLLEPELAENHGHRWDKTVAIKQAFWRKWSREYLQTLQEKNKWTTEHPGPELNDLVLLVDNNLTPLKWKMGKVVKVHVGKDNKVRVVDVQTDSGSFSRAITQICPVPRAKQQVIQ